MQSSPDTHIWKVLSQLNKGGEWKGGGEGVAMNKQQIGHPFDPFILFTIKSLVISRCAKHPEFCRAIKCLWLILMNSMLLFFVSSDWLLRGQLGFKWIDIQSHLVVLIQSTLKCKKYFSAHLQLTKLQNNDNTNTDTSRNWVTSLDIRVQIRVKSVLAFMKKISKILNFQCNLHQRGFAHLRPILPSWRNCTVNQSTGSYMVRKLT